MNYGFSNPQRPPQPQQPFQGAPRVQRPGDLVGGQVGGQEEQSNSSINGVFGDVLNNIKGKPLPSDLTAWSSLPLYMQQLGQQRTDMNALMGLQQQVNNLLDPNLGQEQYQQLLNLINSSPINDEQLRLATHPRDSRTLYGFGFV